MSDVGAQPDESGELAEQLLQTFAAMFAGMRRSDKVRLSAGSLTWAQHAVLKAVVEAERPIRVTDLATLENMAVPSMTIATKKLKEQGLVRRVRDPRDNRSVLLAVTVEGAEAYDASVATAREAVAERLSTFDVAELEALAKALAPFHRLLEIAAETGMRQERLVGR